jgi:hypothetical protein
MRRVVEPEPYGVLAAVREIRHDRVVGVDDERGVVGEYRDRSAPALGDDLELAVPVELVAEQVSERDHPRTETLHRLGESTLVDLEQSELGVARGDEGGTDP